MLIIQGTIHALPPLLLSKIDLFIRSGRLAEYLIFCLAILLPTFLFRYVIFESLLSILNWFIGLKVSLHLRRQLYRHLERLPLAFYQSRTVGEHMYRANADIDSIIPILNSPFHGLQTFISNIYQVILMAYLISVAGSDTILYGTLILIPIYIAVHLLFTIIRRLDYAKRERAQAVTTVLQETIAGIRVVKAFNRARHSLRRYLHAMTRFYRTTQAAYMMNVMVAGQVQNLPIHILWPLSLPFFAYLGLKGHMPVFSWLATVMFTRLFFFFFNNLYSFFQNTRLYLIPIQRLYETLDQPPHFEEPPDAVDLHSFSGRVEFDSVSFSYSAGRTTLSDIGFSLEPGRKLAVIGPSGAGKSTLTSLLLRLYHPDRGNIRLDGHDIGRVRINSILDRTGVILQETFLFGGTIRDNIRYGRPEASDAEVEEAARMADIHDDILNMPGGYDMDVAEGARLSGGQKQRIAIARALIKKPSLLILDEATSSLDIATEDAVIETIRRSFGRVTTLVISHRLHLVRDADEIIVLDKGCVIERGTHETLMRKGGLYAGLHRREQAAPPPAERAGGSA